MKPLYRLAALLLISISIQAQDTKRVLFIGNSYTYSNNMPVLLENLAQSNGDSLIHDSNTPGGYYFRLHKINATTLAKINAQKWDYVVLQEQSQIPSLTPTIVGNDWSPPHAAVLDSLIIANDSCTETVFFMTWGRKNGDGSYCGQHPPVCTYEGMQMELRRTYLQMAYDNDATVSAVGMAWRAAMQADTTLNLYSADESHPNINGSYLAACVFYATLFQKSPSGLNYYAGIDPPKAQFMQNIAQQIVFDSAATWQIGHEELAANFFFQAQGGFSYQFFDSSSNATSYFWDFGFDSSTQANPQLTFPGSGNYTITLTVSNNCDTQTITKPLTIQPTSLTAHPSAVFEVFPNPTTNNIILQGITTSAFVNVQIFDALGVTMYQRQFNTQTADFTQQIELDALPSGVYTLHLQSATSRETKRLVIRK